MVAEYVPLLAEWLNMVGMSKCLAECLNMVAECLSAW